MIITTRSTLAPTVLLPLAGASTFRVLGPHPFPPVQHKNTKQGSSRRTLHLAEYHIHQHLNPPRDKVSDAHPSQLGSFSHCHRHTISRAHLPMPASRFYQLQKGRLKSSFAGKRRKALSQHFHLFLSPMGNAPSTVSSQQPLSTSSQLNISGIFSYTRWWS